MTTTSSPLDQMALIRTTCVAIVALAFFACKASNAAEAPERNEYVLGIFPNMAAGHVEKIFAPVADSFARALNRPVRLRTKPSYEQFTAEIANESYDIALVQPFDYVVAHDRYNYLPLAKRGEPLVGQIMVRQSSEMKSLADLKGRKIALPPENAAVSHLVRFTLLKAGFDPQRAVTLSYFRSHDSCLQQLLIGEVDACGSAAYPVRFFENKWNVKFRVLGKTEAIPHTLFVVHRRVPAEHRATLLKTILSWPESEEGKKLLEFGEMKPFQTARDGEYDAVRKYNALQERRR